MAYNKETGMYEGFIYKIWNDVNDKLYIGQTKATIKDRWHGHMSSALCEKRSKSALYNAMRKYGRDKFHIEQIDKIEAESLELLTEKLDELEILRINQYDSYSYKGIGYNCEFGGVGKRKRILGRMVCKYDDELNLLDTYDSIQEAGRMNNIDGATIWAVCNHQYFRAAGFVWAYEGEIPIKPPAVSESVQKRNNTREKNKKDKLDSKPKPKIKKKHISRALDPEVKRENRLNRLNGDNRRIVQYNAFGEIIGIYNDIVDAIEKIPIDSQELKLNLSGKNLQYKKTIIRYEDKPFDYYPMSPHLHPVVLYDLQGNYVDRFETQIDAEKYLGVSRGELTKVLKRGGSIKGYLVSEYGKPIIRKIMRLEHTYEMLSDDFTVLRTFNKYKEIADMFGVIDCSQSVRKAIKNNTKYRGYYWRFKEEFPVNINI